MSATTKIDSIVRQTILEKNLTPHAYVRLLSFGLSCLKELDLDLTGAVESIELTVDEFGRVKLPCNYVDWTRVGSASGAYVLNMGPTSTFNRKLKLEDGVYVPRTPDPDCIAWCSTQSYWYGWYRNPLGGTRLDEFMVLDGFMQLSGAYAAGDTVTLDYIFFDKANASTNIHKYAESTIQAYMEYKYISHQPRATPYDKSEAKQNYRTQFGLLQGRLNDLTFEGIMRLKARYQKSL